MKKLAWVGLDVHQESIEIAVVDRKDRILYQGGCSADIEAVVKVLKKFRGYQLYCCYEASGAGYILQRGLEKRGYDCEVIAPSLIPKQPGVRVKTDKRDALKLARFSRGGILTAVHIPTEQEETDRSLVRGREQIVGDVKRVKLQILSVFRHRGWNYRTAVKKENASYWTGLHRKWIRLKLLEITDRGLKFMLDEQLSRLEYLEGRLERYDEEILTLAREKRYHKKVSSLSCLRGVDVLTGMVLATELGDTRRFEHPRPLMSYLGLGVKESSSGKKRNQTQLTKTGNSRVRRVLMEAAQYARNPVRVSKALKQRRVGCDTKLVDIADKCMDRLNRKYWRLAHRGKHTNKIKGAVAREMVGFIWDILKTVQAA